MILNDGFIVVSVYVNSFLNNFAFNFCMGGYFWSMPTSFSMSAWQCHVSLIAKFDRHTFFDQYVGCFCLTMQFSQEGGGLWFVFVRICSWSVEVGCLFIGYKSTEACK
jgi:hypothetical protein